MTTVTRWDGAGPVRRCELADAVAALGRSEGLVWIDLDRPSAADLAALGGLLDLHPLAAGNTARAHPRPRTERYDGVRLTALLPAAAEPRGRDVAPLTELSVLTGPRYVVTVRHGPVDLDGARRRLAGTPALLARGPAAVECAVLLEVVDGYQPLATRLEDDVDDVEEEIFSASPSVSRRIYALLRDVMELQRATHPLVEIVVRLTADPDRDEEVRRYLRQAGEHLARVVERLDALRAMLEHAAAMNATIVVERQNDEMRVLTRASLRQNEEIKRISAWAAILFTPTVVGTVYGMNFDVMPELRWSSGYPLAVGLMVLASLVLFAVFRRRRWL
ncbi:magnesium and cobalt transport protein CorA [Actinotalea solisilvae]|uniref:magnesium and cobalt transport protein CorA n=1 Tax=Actinotalea solisilvae TaxID=2072922 RepID=UPI0018F160D9|nr:magnesium and cobalt transport protein CorA [Actinotalea solisilvae]